MENMSMKQIENTIEAFDNGLALYCVWDMAPPITASDNVKAWMIRTPQDMRKMCYDLLSIADALEDYGD